MATGLLSHFFRLADFSGLIGHAIRAAPRSADDVARDRRGWMKWTVPRWAMRGILAPQGILHLLAPLAPEDDFRSS
jgi:hypothetical protein